MFGHFGKLETKDLFYFPVCAGISDLLFPQTEPEK